MPLILRVILLLSALISAPISASQSVQHAIQAQIDPSAGSIDVKDTLWLPEKPERLRFSLNRGLEIVASSLPFSELPSKAPQPRQYRLDSTPIDGRLSLHYRGRLLLPRHITHGGMPIGALDETGIFLDGASAWYPLTERKIVSVDLQVDTRNSWSILSNGRMIGQDEGYHWQSATLIDNLYLIAGPFTVHRTKHQEIDLSVWLLNDDSQLAQTYLQLSADYIDHFSDLIGAYPFGKFAVVENRWQTGFGMPSFTLLGSQVLRLPFIPYTSLPHEVLHNWLGNGIWVDYSKGNWSEGLTAYLADHWMKERADKGAEHRLKSLQRYTSFASAGRDQALLKFVSRHNDTSQAIGYDKSMMLFHMLRNALGDEAFVRALQRLWQNHQFEPLGFTETINTLLEERADLLPRFLPWLEADFAPELILNNVSVEQRQNHFLLEITLSQQGPHALPILLPVWVTTDQDKPALRSLHWFDHTEGKLSIELSQQPLRVDLDAAFEVPRYLAAAEQPLALNRLFGTPTWLVLPHSAESDMDAAWMNFAQRLLSRYPQFRILGEAQEASGNRLILGWDNPVLASEHESLSHADQWWAQNGLSVGNSTYPASQFNVVTMGQRANGDLIGFVGARDTAAIDSLARKLPHYGSYARLIFSPEMQNLHRDSLSSGPSPLSRQLGAKSVALGTVLDEPLKAVNTAAP